ncbi:MAG: ABC transporter permease [Bryobacteraceae bacterium]
MPLTLRNAFRSLRRSPGFALMAVAILTLGIGATTAMFSITRTVLLKPLAYRDPGRLATLLFRIPQFSKEYSTIPINAQHYLLWRDHSRTIEEIGLVTPDSHILSGLGEAEQISGAHITANFFHMLGVQPILGRSFTEEEDQPGHDKVIIVSYQFWEHRLSGRRDVLGHKILLDGQPYELVGVMPPGLLFPRGGEISELEPLPDNAEYWTPVVFSKDDLETPVGNDNYMAVSRLKPGATVPQVITDLTALEKVISKRYPEPVEFDPMVRPLQAAMAREVRLPLLILMAAVFAVLLIVCINLMNLMMVRATAQRRDWAIRLAMGAGTGDLLRVAFVESLLLSLTGAAFGSLLTIWLLQLTRLKAPVDLPRLDELALDPAALLFALGASIATALLFGLWPAWRASRIDPQEALQSSGRTASENRQGRRAGKFLVAAEVTLSTVLLLAAGLLLRSFTMILDVNPGLNVQNLLTVRINLPPDRYQRYQDTASFYRRLEEQVRAMPSVQSAGLVSDLPVTTDNNNNPATAGDRPFPPMTEWPMANWRYASSGYFQAAGIPLKEGRIFEERDGETPEVVISENLAARLWPGESAVGRPLKEYMNPHLFKVIGVVGAVHTAALTEDPTRTMYFPNWQQFSARDMSLFVRSAADPASLASTIRRAILHLEPQAAIPSIQTMKQVVAASLAQKRFEVALLAAFAVAALLLASMGIYGVLAFATSRRTSEIGIRMALGARPTQILESTLLQGMTPVLVGIAAGLLLSAAFARVFQSLLFQVQALDPLIYTGTSVALLGVASLACLIPAHRASRLNPVEALHHE